MTKKKIPVKVYEKVLPGGLPYLRPGPGTYKVINNEVYRVSYI